MSAPLISVVISNKNGSQWLRKCFESVRQQTIFDKLEVVFADNRSEDGALALARKLLADFPQATVFENERDLGFTGGNNRGAEAAKGEWLFFLNNDAWLEKDCLERLLQETLRCKADAASPLVMDYDDDTFQSIGGSGIDIFGFPDGAPLPEQTRELFAAMGAGFLMRAQSFRQLNGFDTGLFMYADETDLSWRLWIAGGKIIAVPSARMHHRGAAGVNPQGGTKVIESRTSETKRYLANRNGILFLMKNGQHILLLLLIPHLMVLLLEACVSLVLVRRWRYVRRSYLGAIIDAFRMMRHVRRWRRHIRSLRRCSDFRMLRFLRLKPSRWMEVKRLFQFGVPKVDAR